MSPEQTRVCASCGTTTRITAYCVACGVLSDAPTPGNAHPTSRAAARRRTPPSRRHSSKRGNRLVVASLIVGIVAVFVLIVTVLALASLGLV